VLATMNKDLGEIKDAAVYVKGNVIQWVGKTTEVTPEMLQADQVISLKGCVATPGLVNSHAHMFQSLTRCMAQNKHLHGWLKSLYPIWRHLKADDVYWATVLSMAELMLSGCTTSSDHLYIFPNDVKLDDTIRAARDLGLRFHPVRGGMSAGISKGGIAPDDVVESEEAILADMKRCIEEFHDNSRYSMLRMNLGPSSQKTVSNELMSESAKLARQYPGVRLHTHLAENQEDIEYTHKLYGYRFKDYINTVGWNKGDCWFAHCCMVNDEEIALFAHEGIGVAHCPSSNSRLASGIAPVRKMLDAGVNVGLGVDGSACNDSQNLIAEARLAMLLQRVNMAGGDPTALSAREALRIATKGGAANLGRDDIGEVAPGFAADLAAWKFDGSLVFAGATADPIGALIMCCPSAPFVNFSCINGRVVVQDGALRTMALETIVAEASKRSLNLQQYITPEQIGI